MFPLGLEMDNCKMLPVINRMWFELELVAATTHGSIRARTEMWHTTVGTETYLDQRKS